MDTISLFLLIGSGICLAIWWFARRHQQQPNKIKRYEETNGVAPQPREIWLDDDHYALVGPRWKWEFDQNATYSCPRCASPEDVKIRAYSSANDGRIYAILRHDCTGELRTEPLLPISGGELL